MENGKTKKNNNNKENMDKRKTNQLRQQIAEFSDWASNRKHAL